MQVNFAVFVNRDRLSGFGTPWEVLFQSNYTVLIKGGNVGGYTALFSFIPELKLGKRLSTIEKYRCFINHHIPTTTFGCHGNIFGDNLFTNTMVSSYFLRNVPISNIYVLTRTKLRLFTL